MQLNTVMYHLLAPKAVLTAAGGEDWSLVAIGPSADVLRDVARKNGLVRFAIVVAVCIETQNSVLQSPAANATPV